MQLNDSIRESFGGKAAAYATSAVHKHGPDLGALVEAAAVTAGTRAVDVACGGGHVTLALARAGARVTAVDITPSMLQVTAQGAAAEGLTIETVQAPATALPFDDGAVDVVTCRVAAHHFLDVGAFVQEAARVLAPGGRLVVSDCVSPELTVADTFVNTIELLRDPSHARDLRVSEWQRHFEAAGLRQRVALEGAFRLDFESWFARMKTPEHRAAMVRELVAQAPAEVRACLRVDSEAFHLPWAVMVGQRG